MLAPFCEGESAPESVVELGQGAIDWWDARVPGVAREGTLVVAPPRDAGEIDRFAARTRAHARVDEARIAALEPDLAGRFRKGLFFAGEGHLDPRAALRRARRRASPPRRRDALRRERRDARAGGGNGRRLPRLRGAARASGIAGRARRNDPRPYARGVASRVRSGFCIRAFPSMSCRARTANS